MIVEFAFGSEDANAVFVEMITEFFRADAVASFVDDKAAIQSANAPTPFVDLETFLNGTENAFVGFVQG